jgi:hypothetical protein
MPISLLTEARGGLLLGGSRLVAAEGQGEQREGKNPGSLRSGI